MCVKRDTCKHDVDCAKRSRQPPLSQTPPTHPIKRCAPGTGSVSRSFSIRSVGLGPIWRRYGSGRGNATNSPWQRYPRRLLGEPQILSSWTHWRIPCPLLEWPSCTAFTVTQHALLRVRTVKCRSRKYSPEQKQFLKDMVTRLVIFGMAYLSRTAKWASALLIVSKQGQTRFQFTADLPAVNRFTIFYHYQILFLNIVLTKLLGAK